MTLCSVCNKNEGIYLCEDTDTKERFYLDEWCEREGNWKMIEDLSKPKEEAIIEQPQERTGRLHIVNKTKKISTCRICKNEIPVGSKCYDQNVYEGNSHFPRKLKVCFLDGEKMIKEGVKVA